MRKTSSGFFVAIVGGIIVVIVLFVLLAGGFQVETGEVGIKKKMGQVEETLYEPGFYVKNPFLDSITIVSLKERKNEVIADSASKDLQSVKSVIALNYSIDKTKVISLFSQVGGNREIEDVLVSPALQESIKASTSQYSASELIQKRELVKNDMEKNIKSKLEERGIKVNQLNIVNFEFSADFNNAIQNKVKAEQEALAEKNKLETVKYQSQQETERAKAEAEKIRIQAEAITKQGGKEYVQLQWIEAWKAGGSKVPETIMGADNPFILNLK